MQHFSETFYNVPVQLLLLYLNVSHKDTEKQMEFSIKDFLDFPGDLVTFIEKILNGKLHFLFSARLLYLNGDRVLFTY